jgi:Matrixin/Fibronectin type III domain
MSMVKITGFFLLLLCASVASATTYVAMTDESLADQAPVVARVKVIDSEPAYLSGMPATEYLVEVESTPKGRLPGSAVAVRVPGGGGVDGLGLRIWGAPEFQLGEEPLLFLRPAPDGSFRVVQLMLGAFHTRRSGDAVLAIQDLSEAHRVGPGLDETAGARDLERFEAWIADRATGVERAPDYWRPALEKFTQMKGDDGIPMRWFAFDDGGSVAWKLDAAGQPGLDPSQAQERLQAALQAWSSDPKSSIQYNYAGLMSAGSGKGLHGTDGANGVLFNDPGSDVAGSFDCRSGGILALSGPYFVANSTRGYRGQPYHEIVEADVVFQDGTECFFHGNPSGLEEVMGHELGHTLGLSHSADRNALMWGGAHNDGRGARLGDDDRMAVSVVYGDGSFQPTPPPPQPVPLKLKAVAKGTDIRLTWTKAPGGTVEFRVERQEGKDSFQLMETILGDLTTVTLSGLTATQNYSLRVVAMGADEVVNGISNVVKVRTKK